MPKRSTQFTIQNNTDQDLTLFAANLCHGSWTNDVAPPSTIAKQSTASWEAESSDIGTTTQGWVKYEITNGAFPQCVPELVYISWNNPFLWTPSTKAINHSITTGDATPDCDKGKGQWQHGGSPGFNQPNFCKHEIFDISGDYNNTTTITWWDLTVNFPVVFALLALDPSTKINLQFTLGLRLKGSLRQTVGPKKVRAIAKAKGQPSVRALFHM
jgi:hypothetical protein